MGILSFLFGNKKSIIKEYQAKGAIILDVRTTKEYKRAAITGSKNMPLKTIKSKVENIKTYNKPIITYHVSGVRSANAASILKNNGIEAINGGGWKDLKSKL